MLQAYCSHTLGRFLPASRLLLYLLILQGEVWQEPAITEATLWLIPVKYDFKFSCAILFLYCEVQTESQDVLYLGLGESEHIEGFCLHIVGNIVGTCSVVARLAPLVAPSEGFNSHIGHEFKIGDFI